jgi:hypothetical protein
MVDQEFFTVHHALTVNVEPLGANESFPSEQAFEAEIPEAFAISSEFSTMEQLNDLARQELQQADVKHLIQLLDSQNRKLNLLLNLTLSQFNDPLYRYQTTSFGASQFSYIEDCSGKEHCTVSVDTKLRVKLFLNMLPSAIYCYAHVTECHQEENHVVVTAKYDLLRDSDQDLLIKAALCEQQRYLRQRSLNKDK